MAKTEEARKLKLFDGHCLSGIADSGGYTSDNFPPKPNSRETTVKALFVLARESTHLRHEYEEMAESLMA